MISDALVYTAIGMIRGAALTALFILGPFAIAAHRLDKGNASGPATEADDPIRPAA